MERERVPVSDAIQRLEAKGFRTKYEEDELTVWGEDDDEDESITVPAENGMIDTQIVRNLLDETEEDEDA